MPLPGARSIGQAGTRLSTSRWTTRLEQASGNKQAAVSHQGPAHIAGIRPWLFATVAHEATGTCPCIVQQTCGPVGPPAVFGGKESNGHMENRPYKERFWGKADRGNPDRVHLLEHHLADVAACLEALLQQPIIRHRLAHTAGRTDLDGTTAARLCVFAALHDIGKVNTGFQTQVWRDDDFPEGRRRPGRAGHTRDLTPVLNCTDHATAEWFLDALDWWWDATESWDDCGGETVCDLLVAALSHHGQPLQMAGGRAGNPGIWRRFAGLDPREQVARIGQLVRNWFPAAFAEGGLPLPSAPAFQHHFLGLCNLADWLGSDERWFPFLGRPNHDYIATARERACNAIGTMGLDATAQRGRVSRAGVPSLGELFPNIEMANAIQEATHRAPLEEQLVVIESETGSGKTEAALLRFVRLYEAGLVDGLYFALPTRAAAVQIHGRVNDFIARLFSPGTAPETVLAVPGYLQAGGSKGRHLQDYEVRWDDDVRDGRRWAAENPKRFLMAQIAVGTIDQAMLGALQVKNAHMRSAGLARNLLVVDEVHASDTYMSEVLAAVLDAHLGAGGHALLMSATLGATARHRLLDGDPEQAPALEAAMAAPYPAVSTSLGMTSAGENNQPKDVAIRAEPHMQDFSAVAARALEAARAGAKVLVVRNTVGYAVHTQQALETAFGASATDYMLTVNGIPTLHHGRFAGSDRVLLDGEVESRLGRKRPPGGLVVVGTQTLEQSLDIDADLLITDLCPSDVLLQRIGRLHRHRRHDRPGGYQKPRCIVLTPPGGDLEPLLSSGAEANGLGPDGGVYRNLHALEATRRLIGEHPRWEIPAMNRELVERATHREVLEAITTELGEAWKEHAINTAGGYLADVQTARSHLIRRDKSFFTDNQEVCFPNNDERVRTRLGDDRIEIVFDPKPRSPFGGERIGHMGLSSRWLSSPDGIPESVGPTMNGGGGFEFAVNARRFRYDRLGLQRE